MENELDVDVDDIGDSPEPQGDLSKQSITDAEALSELLKSEIQKAVTPIQNELRGLQGRQDKADYTNKGVQEFMAEYRKQLASGKSDEAAEVAATQVIGEREKTSQRDLLLEAIAKKLNLNPASFSAGSGTTEEVSDDQGKVLKEFSLSPTDVEVVSLLRSHKNPVDFAIQASKLSAKKALAPNPTKAQDPAPIGDAGKKRDETAILAELNTLLKSGSSHQSMARIKELEKEMGW